MESEEKVELTEAEIDGEEDLERLERPEEGDRSSEDEDGQSECSAWNDNHLTKWMVAAKGQQQTRMNNFLGKQPEVGDWRSSFFQVQSTFWLIFARNVFLEKRLPSLLQGAAFP